MGAKLENGHEFYNDGMRLKTSEKYREAAAAFKQAVEKDLVQENFT